MKTYKMKHMKKSALLLLALSLSTVQLLAAGSYRLVQRANHTQLISEDAQPIVLAEFDNPITLKSLPAEVRSLLSTYEGVEDEAAYFAFAATSDNDSVGPLLGGIMYDQGTPYNDLCPIINGRRAVTGCVATAMAQVMRYWRYPDVGTGTATYTSSRGAAEYNFANHPFDWDNMLETYTLSRLGVPNYNDTQATAIATLMLACGASVNMDYDYAGSSSNVVYTSAALRDYFKYSSNIRFYESNEPNWEDWTETLKEQFDRGLPVIYGGIATVDGHAFVLDGYKLGISETTGNPYTLFHVNWGWNGDYNGWFRLRNLRASEDHDNYSNMHQRMVVNIYPNGWQAIDDISEEPQANSRKLIKDGRLIIERNNTLYSVQGQRIQ